jgi:predicted nucleic acid-binding protein
VSDQWVCNASPLILLKRIDHLRLLTDLCDTLVIPKSVVNEILHYKEESLTWETFLASPKVTRVQSDITIEPTIAGWDLGKGESEVLSWALTHPEYEAILDDLSARKCARSLGIPLRGTVGIILLAKKRSYISKAAPLIKSLIDAGLRFDMRWINKALELVGENLKLD